MALSIFMGGEWRKEVAHKGHGVGNADDDHDDHGDEIRRQPWLAGFGRPGKPKPKPVLLPMAMRPPRHHPESTANVTLGLNGPFLKERTTTNAAHLEELREQTKATTRKNPFRKRGRGDIPSLTELRHFFSLFSRCTF